MSNTIHPRVLSGFPSLNRPDGDQLVINASFKDELMRTEVDDRFDGLERVFAHVPIGPNDSWEVVELQHWYSTPASVSSRGGGVSPGFDTYRADIHGLTAAQREALRENGVAFGATTNVGDVWAQAPGQNKPVHLA